MAAIPEPLRLDDEALAAIRSDPALSAWFALRAEDSRTGLWNFRPRPDRPEEFDQQASFVYNRDGVAFFLKGNAAGGTEAAAYKTALFLLCQQPPPRPDTPFWIISDKQSQCVDVCWTEKLFGHRYIPSTSIDWARVEWYSQKGNRPKRVPLKPWPAERGGKPGCNWTIELKSYAEGRESMQAASIGGFWFSEQFPWEVFVEVLRGTRDYSFPGGQFCEFTPIDPSLCEQLGKLMAAPPPGYRFYRGSTERNRPNLAKGWYERFVATLPEEMRACRLTGALAAYEGAIYPTFSTLLHVGRDEDFRFPPGAEHARAIDWGDSPQHATVCLWGYVSQGVWHIYDEYWSTDQTRIAVDHAAEVLARSIAWGWPVPAQVAHPTEATRYLAVQTQRRLAEMRVQGSEVRGQRAESREQKSEILNPEPRTLNPLPRDQRHGYTYADPENLAQLKSFTAYGIPCAPASKNVHEGINEVRSHLKINPFTGRPRLLIHPRCKHLLDELPRYRWDHRQAGRGRPVKEADDAVDALRYLLYSHNRASGETASSLSARPAREGRRGVQLDRTKNMSG